MLFKCLRFGCFTNPPPARRRRPLAVEIGSLLDGAGVESLEPRRLLSGLVTVSVTNSGNLVLGGDRLDNRVQMTVQTDGSMVLTSPSDTQFRYQGATHSEVQLDMSTVQQLRDLRVNMRGGNDQLTIQLDQGLMLSGNLTVNLGPGNNRSEIFASRQSAGSRLEVTRNVVLQSAVGDDAWKISGLDARGAVRISMGAGMNLADAEGSTVAGAFRVAAGSDDNLLSVRASVITGDLVVRTGGGRDTVTMQQLIVQGRADLALGSADDLLQMTKSDFRGPFNANLGAGDDHVDLTLGGSASAPIRFQPSTAWIRGGPGEDRITGLAFSNLYPENLISIEASITV